MSNVRDYIPRSGVQFNIFQNNLWKYIVEHQPGTAEPWRYSQARVDQHGLLKQRFDTAWEKAKNKATRTQGQVKEKDDARALYQKSIRQFVNEFLRNNSLISNEQRVKMQLALPNPKRTPAAIPDTVPSIHLTHAPGCRILLHFKQPSAEEGGKSKAKPKGVNRVDIIYKIDEKAPLSPTECNQYTTATRSPKAIQLNSADKGKQVHFFCRWVNTRNDQGPWTQAVSIYIA